MIKTTPFTSVIPGLTGDPLKKRIYSLLLLLFTSLMAITHWELAWIPGQARDDVSRWVGIAQ